MKHGARPLYADERDYSAHLTFGTINPLDMPLEYTVDRGRPMPDQNADGYPMACTGYSQSDNAGNEDDTLYDPAFTYKKTCFMEGHDETQGCDVRNSLESLRIYGLKAVAETEGQTTEHRRGAYFQIWNDGGLDYFDGLRSAVVIHKRGVTIGSPWFPEWTSTASSGDTIMPVPQYTGRALDYPWHNYTVVGWRVIKGVQYLVAKPWQGQKFGDRGYVYLSRAAVNRTLAIAGSCAFSIAKYTPQDVVPIKLSLIHWCIVYLTRILGIRLYN